MNDLRLPAAETDSLGEARYRTLFEHAADAIVVYDVDAGVFDDANPSACRLFGLTREAFLASSPAALSPEFQPDGQSSKSGADKWIDDALAGEQPEFPWTHRTATGIDLHCVVRLVRLPSRNRRLVQGSVRDVTRHRSMETRVRRSQKMEALGWLTGGVAHDFRNLLTVMLSSAEALMEQLREESPLRAEAILIHETATRGAILTGQLVGFAKERTRSDAVVDLNGVVGAMSHVLQRLVNDRIRLRLILDPLGAPVQAERSQLEQVLLNLVVNAADAMPDGGTVTIRTTRLRHEVSIGDPPCVVEGPAVQLLVQDTGVGMDDETRARIFEPFFTTKREEHGTGLGLSIVQGIVREARGCVLVASRIGAGTTFGVVLPAADPIWDVSVA